MSGNAVEKLLAKKKDKQPGRTVPEARKPKPPMTLPGASADGGDVPPVDVPPGPGQYGRLPKKLVAPNPRNPRHVFHHLDVLAQSIRTDGQLQPVTVVTRVAYLKLFPDDEATIGNTEWVACMGSRRILAIKNAPDLTHITAVVDDNLAETHLRFHKAAIEENQKRADLTPMEEGRAYIEIADVVGRGGQTRIAEMFGLSKAYVSQRITLLQLIEAVQAVLDRPDQKELMPLAVAVKLAKLEHAQQDAVARPILSLVEEAQFTAWKQWAATEEIPAQLGPETAADVHAVNNPAAIEATAAPAITDAPATAAPTLDADAAVEATDLDAPRERDVRDDAGKQPAPLAPVSAPPRRETVSASVTVAAEAAPAATVDADTDRQPDSGTDDAAAPQRPSKEGLVAAKAAASVLGGLEVEVVAEALVTELDATAVSKLANILVDYA